MYSDPDGEFWLSPVLTYATFFGIGNLVAHAIRGDVQNFNDGLKYFGQGATVGAAVGGTWSFAPVLFHGGKALQASISIYSFLQSSIGVAGTITGALNGGWGGVRNGAELFLGNFYFDENNWSEGVAQGFLRHTWEMPQSLLGHAFSQFRNTIGNVSRVDFLGGATFATKEESEHHMGVTIGNYPNIWIFERVDGFVDEVKNDQIFMHEYGHTFQSRKWGPIYLLSVGLPSLISAYNATWIPNDPYHASTHDYFWPEYHANRYAARYFKLYYNYDWNEIKYPFDDYRPH